MAILTTKKRKSLPASQFAGPGRTYPIYDAAHARNALARASQEQKAGHLTEHQKAMIDTKAHAALCKFNKGKC